MVGLDLEKALGQLRQGAGMPLASPITVTVKRRSNGSFVGIGPLAQVEPYEPIRIKADGHEHVIFRIFTTQGAKIWEKKANVGLRGTAWVDTTAPSRPDFYEVQAETLSFPDFWNTDKASTDIHVIKDAMPPPSPPPSEGIIPGLPSIGEMGGWLGDIKGILIVGLIIFLVYQGSKLVKT